ncbi:hypothetical protein cand_021420 [Cryptosporidium andersoni]|uniref:TPM domain-containing protein n=1 Tax=Cryptosporidium andersoni TaxID=117008 RepID=A0A1J4MSJ8_9CRYT|nr:hypothetical protein cand_021420 [Cryptosporidium andersoni]
MSFICDPANLLSKEEADSIDAILQEIRETATHKCGNGQVGYPIDIAILPANSGNNSSIATDLLKVWTISNSGCDDGIILVYLQSEDRVSVRWGSGVEPALNVMIYPELISEIDQVLREKSLGAGLYHAISLIRKQLKGNIGPPRRLPQLLVLAVIGGITVLGFGALVATAISEIKPQRSQSRSGRRHESQQILNRIQKMIKTGRLDTDLCPLTLLDLNRSGIPYVVSNKGYKFEARAYTLWMQTNRCGPETDPLTEAIKKDEYIMSTKDDVPPELRKLPIKVYLESLMRIYPDIITEQNIRDFLRNTDRWILP